MRKAGLEPAWLAPPPPQDGVSANSTTSAFGKGSYGHMCGNISSRPLGNDKYSRAWREERPAPPLPRREGFPDVEPVAGERGNRDLPITQGDGRT